MSGKEDILDNLSSARRHIRYAEAFLHGSELIHLDELGVSIKKAEECLKTIALGNRAVEGTKK